MQRACPLFFRVEERNATALPALRRSNAQMTFHGVDFGFEFAEICAVIGENGAKAGVEFSGARVSGDLRNVGRMQTGAGHDNDAICSGRHEVAEGCRAFGSTVGSAGSKDARGTGLDHVFKRAKKVGSVVEGAMEGDFERARSFDEFARAFDIDGIVFPEDAESSAIEREISDGGDRTEHGCEFGNGVDEVAGAGTDNGEDGDFEFFMNCTQRGDGRSDTTMGEFGAEFDAVSAATFCGQGGVERLDGDFQEAFGGHLALVEADGFIYP
jgi:hypothetical protein